jgi:hypothetical protein
VVSLCWDAFFSVLIHTQSLIIFNRPSEIPASGCVGISPVERLGSSRGLLYSTQRSDDGEKFIDFNSDMLIDLLVMGLPCWLRLDLCSCLQNRTSSAGNALYSLFFPLYPNCVLFLHHPFQIFFQRSGGGNQFM